MSDFELAKDNKTLAEQDWFLFCSQAVIPNIDYRQVSNISTLVGNWIVDHSALLQLHLHSQLNIWLQRIG